MSISIQGFKHFVVFKGVVEGRVVLADPAFGNMTLTKEKFGELWKQRIFFTLDSSTFLAIDNKSKPISKSDLRFVRESSQPNNIGPDLKPSLHLTRSSYIQFNSGILN